MLVMHYRILNFKRKGFLSQPFFRIDRWCFFVIIIMIILLNLLCSFICSAFLDVFLPVCLVFMHFPSSECSHPCVLLDTFILDLNFRFLKLVWILNKNKNSNGIQKIRRSVKRTLTKILEITKYDSKTWRRKNVLIFIKTFLHLETWLLRGFA